VGLHGVHVLWASAPGTRSMVEQKVICVVVYAAFASVAGLQAGRAGGRRRPWPCAACTLLISKRRGAVSPGCLAMAF